MKGRQRAHREGTAEGEVVIRGHVSEGVAGTGMQHKDGGQRARGCRRVAQLQEPRHGRCVPVEERLAAANSKPLLHLQPTPLFLKFKPSGTSPVADSCKLVSLSSFVLTARHAQLRRTMKALAYGAELGAEGTRTTNMSRAPTGLPLTK